MSMSLSSRSLACPSSSSSTVFSGIDLIRFAAYLGLLGQSDVGIPCSGSRSMQPVQGPCDMYCSVLFCSWIVAIDGRHGRQSQMQTGHSDHPIYVQRSVASSSMRIWYPRISFVLMARPWTVDYRGCVTVRGKLVAVEQLLVVGTAVQVPSLSEDFEGRFNGDPVSPSYPKRHLHLLTFQILIPSFLITPRCSQCSSISALVIITRTSRNPAWGEGHENAARIDFGWYLALLGSDLLP
ncbi:hypothetical protein DL98DRAFT_526131 [Cadophora sp. DSE1049]|nr:hypothetical protein DL98DRAFT_526131 [Cadophora sp. DSE1049]